MVMVEVNTKGNDTLIGLEIKAPTSVSSKSNLDSLALSGMDGDV